MVREFSTKTELKNLNSFSNVRKGLGLRSATSGAINFAPVVKFAKNTSKLIKQYLMRVKEGAAKIPQNQDLPLFEISDEWIVRTELPEFPKERHCSLCLSTRIIRHDVSASWLPIKPLRLLWEVALEWRCRKSQAAPKVKSLSSWMLKVNTRNKLS